MAILPPPEPEPTPSNPAAALPSPFAGCRVSMFENAFGKVPRDADLASILEAVRKGRWREQVEALRALLPANLVAYDDRKRFLPGFCMSGTGDDRKQPRTHSGLLQIDLDHLNGDLATVRERVKADPHVAFGFVSPSGVGLKLGVRIDSERHAESFAAAQAYFQERYGAQVDPKVKDRLRLCFVSYDPELWVSPHAQPLPLDHKTLPTTPTPPQAAEPEVEGPLPEPLMLPSSQVSFCESAREIFTRIAPSRTLFQRGGALVELVNRDGISTLEVLRPEGFRSRVEKFGMLVAWRTGQGGAPELKPTRMPRDDAVALMATTEARELLPPIASVLRCSVLIEPEPGRVEVLGKGYHPELGGLLIVEGEPPHQLPIEQAADYLRWLLEEFHFQSEGDRSRGLAALITPALRMGGHLKGNVPIDCAEATESQSGKGYRHSLVCALYGEIAYLVTARQGGVGSVDESFASALMAGRPFICLDNFRGRLDSQHLEAFLTCPGLFPARIPHRGEVLLDPRRFLLQITSNGLEATRDLVNRASICRIFKRPGYAYRDTLGEVLRLQSTFLGAVFSIITAWIAAGKPRTQETRHDFREWCQTLDWIVQNLLGATALMDGHPAAQERASNPALSWLRSVALAVEAEGQLGESLIASTLVELCDIHGLDIPGLKDPTDEDRARKQVGMLMRRLFQITDTVELDGFKVSRGHSSVDRAAGGAIEIKTYTFHRP
jgi:hypothetical protein